MSRLYNFVSSAGVCAVTGAIAGAFVGALFGVVERVSGMPSIAAVPLLEVAIGLSIAAWFLVLVIVGVFGNYGVLAIAGQSFVTCVLTGIVTVGLIHAVHAGFYGMLLGWVVGFLIGKLLCTACSASQRRTI